MYFHKADDEGRRTLCGRLIVCDNPNYNPIHECLSRFVANSPKDAIDCYYCKEEEQANKANAAT